MTHVLVQYSYLQVLDFLTTLAFLLAGVQEANPIIRWMLQTSSSPLVGLLTIKLLAVCLGILVWRAGRLRLLSRINIMFAVLVAWNLVSLIFASVSVA